MLVLLCTGQNRIIWEKVSHNILKCKIIQTANCSFSHYWFENSCLYMLYSLRKRCTSQSFSLHEKKISLYKSIGFPCENHKLISLLNSTTLFQKLFNLTEIDQNSKGRIHITKKIYYQLSINWMSQFLRECTCQLIYFWTMMDGWFLHTEIWLVCRLRDAVQLLNDQDA
jgi:hypothetical protein